MSKPSGTVSLIEFECRGQRLALPLGCVRCVVPSAAPAALPGTSEIVLGALNIAGEVVPLLDLCPRLGLPATELAPSQQILVVELAGLAAALVVDRVSGVTERAPGALLAAEIAPAPIVAGVARLEDGLCLIVDPAHFLFHDERRALVRALEAHADAGL